jgi:hypothetical protein
MSYEDKDRDATLTSLGFDKKRLLTVAKRQIVFSAPNTEFRNAPQRLN